MSRNRVKGHGWCQLVCVCFLVILALFLGSRTDVPAETQGGEETRISGQMLAVDGGALMGVIAIEKGRLYKKDYKYGGLVDENGRFSVKVPKGGDYGLHLYATGYIYYPVGVEAKTGEDNQFTVTLPPNPVVEDAPVLSEVQFEPKADSPNQVVIRLSVHDPNDNLSHQVLGVNVRTQEGFIFSPPKFVAPWTRNYPNGVYTLTYDTRGRPFDPKEWLFVTADNRCYNSSVLGPPFTEEGVVPARPPGKAQPSMPTTQQAEAPETGSLPEIGRKIFANNCVMCHHPDKTKTKVGPGLKGLFKRRLTPVRRVPVTEENIRAQVQNGSEYMPPYSHIKGEGLSALIAYLKTL